jgi:hypothetical protein
MQDLMDEQIKIFMKFSETEEPLKQIRIDYINNRWKQLLELVEDSGKTALQYLFLTNSGGAATTLAFIGTVGVDKIGSEVKFALGFFVLGVILVGFTRAREFYHLKGLFNQWKLLTNGYFINEKSWEEIIEADNKKVDGEKLVLRLPWLSFICFIIGCGLGASALLTHPHVTANTSPLPFVSVTNSVPAHPHIIVNTNH